MRLIIKRYGLPLVITLGVYTLLYLFCGKGTAYFNTAFFVALLYAILMRFADDIIDYEKDVAANKAPIKRHFLMIGGGLVAAIIMLLSALSAFWWLIMPLVLIGLLFVCKGVAADFLKPLFTPAVVIAVTISVFKWNIYTWILIAILIILDGILVYKRRK